MPFSRSIVRRDALKLLGASLAAPAFLRSAHAAEVTFRLHHFLPPVATAHRTMMEPWAERIKSQSGGRIDVQVYPAMQLGGRPSELVDQVRDGVADISWALPHYQPGRYPLMETWTLPFMVTNAAQTSPAIWEFMSGFAAAEFQGFVPLAWWAQSPGVFMTKGFPVTRAADLKGRRIRGGNEIITKTLSELGANGVFFPVSETPQNLTTGTVDGVALPYEIVPAYRFHELVDNFSEPEAGARALYTVPMVLLMNRSRYESLPDDLRAVIDANSGELLSREFGATFNRNDAVGRQMVVDAGVTINTIPADEIFRWRTASQVVFDGYSGQLDKAGHNGAAVIAAVDALVDSYAKA